MSEENPFAAPASQAVRPPVNGQLAPHGARFLGAVIDYILFWGAFLAGLPFMVITLNPKS